MDDDIIRPNRTRLKNNLRCVCIGLCVFCLFLGGIFFLFGANVKKKTKQFDLQLVIFTENLFMVQCVKCVFVYNVLRKKSTIVRLVDGSSGKTPKNKMFTMMITKISLFSKSIQIS